eukprot:4214517-Prymnesium_polylepis.1
MRKLAGVDRSGVDAVQKPSRLPVIRLLISVAPSHVPTTTHVPEALKSRVALEYRLMVHRRA